MNEQQIEAVIQNMRQLWSNAQSVYDKLPDDVKNFVENIPQVIGTLDLDNDRRNKREVNLEIAKFLQKEFTHPLPVCLSATHILCRECDKYLLEEAALSGQQLAEEAKALAEEAKALIMRIEVHYEPLEDRMYNRQTEIFFIKQGKPALHKVEHQLSWDELSEDVRNSRIYQGQQALKFTLYLQDK